MKKNSRGFTIIELMIATVIFSLILLVCMTAFITIGRVFYKGIVTARTNQVATSVMNQVSQQTVLGQKANLIDAPVVSGNTINGKVTKLHAVCIGTIRYTAREGAFSKVTEPVILSGNGSANFGLRRDTSPSPCVSSEVSNGTNVGELLGDNMFISFFHPESNCKVAGGNICSFHLVISYVGGDASDIPTFMTNPTLEIASCKNEEGFQFCATQPLHSTIFRGLR